ncbi:hypothetical protein TNCV_639131 [Trichonephila clavipes]|nr:hypothetical protein TNCV_639131 [Trichonephila clavipes]
MMILKIIPKKHCSFISHIIIHQDESITNCKRHMGEYIDQTSHRVISLQTEILHDSGTMERDICPNHYSIISTMVCPFNIVGLAVSSCVVSSRSSDTLNRSSVYPALLIEEYEKSTVVWLRKRVPLPNIKSNINFDGFRNTHWSFCTETCIGKLFLRHCRGRFLLQKF